MKSCDRCQPTVKMSTLVKMLRISVIMHSFNIFFQIGLFFCRGPVTSLDAVFVDGRYFILAGDKTGNVEFLEFFK